MGKIGHTLRLKLGTLDKLRAIAVTCGLVYGGVGSASQLLDALAALKGPQRAALVKLIKKEEE